MLVGPNLINRSNLYILLKAAVKHYAYFNIYISRYLSSKEFDTIKDLGKACG